MPTESLIPSFDFIEQVIEPWTRHAQITAWVVGMGVLVTIPCALLGCFLVLRGKALLGDAISHALLAGLAGAFLVTGSRGATAMVSGAVLTGVVTVVLIELIHRHTRVKEDAAIAVVFSTLFALGVVLVTRFTEGVDLDANCVLYGEIEMSWLRPDRVRTMAIVAALVAAGVVLFFKELMITSFDPATATALGISAAAVHYALMMGVSVTVVGGMEAVGAILVVTMLIAPGATAYLLTDRLKWMLLLSAACGVLSALVGFHLAWWLDCTTAGAMSLVATGLFVVALLASPRHGVIMRAVRRSRLAARIVRENLLRAIYNLSPSPEPGTAVPTGALSERLRMLPVDLDRTCRHLQRGGWLELEPDREVRLTDRGFGLAKRIVRAHRLWETFLVSRVGVAADHAHPDAEEIEHLLGERLLDRVDDLLGHPETDPHGAQIPRHPSLSEAGVETVLAKMRRGDVARVRGVTVGASEETVRRIEALRLPLGARIELDERSEAGDWVVRLPDGSTREVDHKLADGIEVELRQPAIGA